MPKWLFLRLMAPEDEGAGGGTAGGGEAASGGATPSIDDTIRSTYSKLMSEGAGDEPADEAGEDGKRVPVKAHSRRVKTLGSEPPAKAGKQSAGKQQAQPAEAATADGTQGDEQQGKQQQQPEPAAQPKPHDVLPNTWPKEMDQEWKALPEKAREQIYRREQQFHDGIGQYKSAASFGSAMAKEMLPYQKIMQEKNVTPQVIVRDIMGALNTMATGTDEAKANQFLQLATQYGINLDTVLSLRQRAPGQSVPELTALQREVGELRASQQAQTQERERLQREQDDQRVNAFLSDPKNEHAKTVAKEMAALLSSGQADDLADAYNKALWINPDTRKALLDKQEKERQAKEAEQAAAARKAAAANVNRRGTPPAPAKPGTMEDTIRSTYRRLNGGG